MCKNRRQRTALVVTWRHKYIKQNRNGNTRRYHYDKKKTEVTKESENHDEQWRGPQKTEEENLEVLQWQADREE